MQAQNKGVGAVHPQLVLVKDFIEMTEDAIEGDVRTPEYVPPFTGMSTQSYAKYLARAAYFNLSARTLASVVGSMVRKPYSLEGEGLHLDETYSLEDGLIDIYSVILATGRVGFLWDPTPTDPRRVVMYDSDDILNWSDTFVVLKADRLEADKDDPFTQVLIERRLVLQVIEGAYTMTYWRMAGGPAKAWVQEGEPVVPLFRGKALTYIPFQPATPMGLVYEPPKPPMHTLAALNIQHFNVSLTIAYGSRFFALPKPYIAGNLKAVGTDGQPPSTITLGQEDVLLLDQGGTAGYMEFTNSGGMGFLADERTKLEEQMVLLGSRMLTQKTGVESIEAMSLRMATETATLTAIVKVVEAALNTLLEWMAQVDGKQSTITLNKDLSPTHLSPQQVEVLLKAVIAGSITNAQFVEKLYEAEMVAPPEAPQA